jgi:endonuclease-8
VAVPEGDTIFRTARTLRSVLAGRQVTRFASRVPQVRTFGVERLVGQTVAEVEARGKHLLVWFAPADLALHTHMMLSGSWHTYRPGQDWRKAEGFAKAVVEVPGTVAVCFSAPVCEVLSRAQIQRHRSLAALGPDALGEAVDLAEARRRLDMRAQAAIGEALLDQRVLAGVGNVYKCEVLFVHGVDPWARVADLDPSLRDALLATAERLLKANVGTASPVRVTTGQPASALRGRDRVHVYGKARRPCPRCGTPIRVARQGQQARLTYWCPGCQRPGGRGRATR